MLNEWLKQISDCGYTASVYRFTDEECLVVLHGNAPTTEALRVFTDVDADKCLDAALQFALNYDAYVNNAALCGSCR